MIQILGLLGMYFDAVVVEVKTFLLLFRLALAILWSEYAIQQKEQETETNENSKNQLYTGENSNLLILLSYFSRNCWVFLSKNPNSGSGVAPNPE